MSIADDYGVLAARAREGDQVAFRQLVARHKEPLYRLLRRLSGDPDEAYDLLQETFVGLWSSLDRYDAARPLRRRATVRRLGPQDRGQQVPRLGEASDGAAVDRRRPADRR